jgi:ATPase, YjeE family
LLLLLSGDLGTGKTVLARGIVEGLAGENVRSPSFTLVNEYEAEIPVTHADLYRLSCCRFEDLGLEEALDEGRLVLVEWAQNWKEPPQGDTWEFFLEIPGAGQESDARLIRIRATGKRATASLGEIRRHMASN